jgi:HEAT repeat protein
MPGSRILANMLVLCGVSVAGSWFCIPLGIDLLYPVLFVLKSLYEVLLGLLFWNLANDLFDTRQSKRLFPLITAGGVIGGVIGSFGTPLMAVYFRIDNLLWVYLVTTVAGSIIVRRMAAIFPTMSLGEGKGKKVKKRKRLTDEFKEVVPLIKDSALVKVLVLLTLLPNIVIPIMNYQFNYVIDQSFATEGGMIEFFGYFRGFLNVISFIILLFVGRIYGRWGLPVALMFHPFNYVVAFLGFLSYFNIYAAMYARMTTNILRTTINNPARAVLMGLFPVEYRSLIRPFLRGTVVRIGILVGSGIIMASDGLFHPRYLSVVALVFMAGWVTTTLVFKKIYSKILLDLISRNLLDMKSLEAGDVTQIFQDKGIQGQMVESFFISRGSTCLWYADLMKSLGIKELDSHLLTVLPEQDDQTKIGLLELLSEEAGPRALPVFRELMDSDKPELSSAVLRAASRMPQGLLRAFLKEEYQSQTIPVVRAHAVAGLYGEDRETYRGLIDEWLESVDPELLRAGIVAAGGSNDEVFIPKLKNILDETDDRGTLASVFKALDQINPPDLFELVSPFLTHDLEMIRGAALEAIQVSDDDAVHSVIPLLGDREGDIRELAYKKLSEGEYQNSQLLIESLGVPNPLLRENVFRLLETLEIRDVEVLRFAMAQLERAYRNVIEAEAVRNLKEGPYRDLLVDHLTRKKRDRLDTILRVLATQDSSGQMRLIWRGVFSVDPRQRSNALEALDDSVGNGLSRLMLPMLEDQAMDEIKAIAKKEFNLGVFSGKSKTLGRHFLNKRDWVTVALTLKLIGEGEFVGLALESCRPLLDSPNPHIRLLARDALREGDGTPSPEEIEMANDTSISIPDKILHLRGIQIFEGLSVGEMAAIASVTEEVVSPVGEEVIREGDSGETMYMIISGQVSVIKGRGTQDEIEIDRINPGDYFGEMALFEDEVRSATILTVEESRLLVLHKREFEEIVREYPQIALHICKVLSQRLRRLHNRFKE